MATAHTYLFCYGNISFACVIIDKRFYRMMMRLVVCNTPRHVLASFSTGYKSNYTVGMMCPSFERFLERLEVMTVTLP